MNVADISDPEFWEDKVGAVTEGGVLPYALRDTVQDGDVNVVYVTEVSNDTVSLFDVVEVKEDDPLTFASSSFCGQE